VSSATILTPHPTFQPLRGFNLADSRDPTPARDFLARLRHNVRKGITVAKADKLIAQAKDHLQQGEVIEAVVSGTYVVLNFSRHGILLATDRRIVLYGKKMTGFDLQSFPYGNISSYEQSKSMGRHAFAFFAAGNRTVMQSIKDVDTLATFVKVVKTRLGQSPIAAVESSDAAATPSVIDQIKQLGSLREAGILTEEEFISKKGELLSPELWT
jgi:hypothetical protein